MRVDKKERRHLFGPVPSRRLGRSLGIDLVPHKVCSLDCVYCECGGTTVRTLERRAWVPTADVLAELEAWLAQGGSAEYLTFSGAGEPTLHSDLGHIARWLVTRTDIPLALLTNSTLLPDPAVRRELYPCSLICPSLDAVDDETYRRINRPHPGLTAADLIEGLVALRDEFSGLIWLEILLLEGINDSAAALDGFARAIERIRPDKVQLNTAVRPGTEDDAVAASDDVLTRALERFGDVAEPVATFSPTAGLRKRAASAAGETIADAILEVTRRRPESVLALGQALGIDETVCSATVQHLHSEGLVHLDERAGRVFVTAVDRA